jgi:hypothetical protein
MLRPVDQRHVACVSGDTPLGRVSISRCPNCRQTGSDTVAASRTFLSWFSGSDFSCHMCLTHVMKSDSSCHNVFQYSRPNVGKSNTTLAVNLRRNVDVSESIVFASLQSVGNPLEYALVVDLPSGKLESIGTFFLESSEDTSTTQQVVLVNVSVRNSSGSDLSLVNVTGNFSMCKTSSIQRFGFLVHAGQEIGESGIATSGEVMVFAVMRIPRVPQYVRAAAEKPATVHVRWTVSEDTRQSYFAKERDRVLYHRVILQQLTDASKEYSTVVYMPKDETSWDELASGLEYLPNVAACNALRCSDAQPAARSVVAMQVPQPPLNLRVLRRSWHQVAVSWDAPPTLAPPAPAPPPPSCTLRVLAQGVGANESRGGGGQGPAWWAATATPQPDMLVVLEAQPCSQPPVGILRFDVTALLATSGRYPLLAT